ncbi:hypothetical protein ATCC90586_003757 [Pythium insidiosum]|nr:hypothetical protein ATCC90586_003757 [Pythium insidiosum]
MRPHHPHGGGGGGGGGYYAPHGHPHPHPRAHRGAPPPPYHHAAPAPFAGGPPLPPGPPAAVSPADIAAFVSTLRASRSDPSAPPNALSLSAAVHAVCAHFGASSLQQLTASPALPPPLRQIQIQNERVWTFVTCYAHARRLHTLHDCHAALLQHEGVARFSDLGIGNAFVLCDAVQSVYGGPARVFPISTRDVLHAVRQYERLLAQSQDAFSVGAKPSYQHQHHQQQQHIDREGFKRFLAQQHRQPSVEAMGVYIDSEGFGAYIGMLRRVAKREMKELQELQDEFNKGIAERVFEISKKQFSAENRQQALNELLARTHAAGAAEVPHAGAKSADKASTGAHTTLASLSLDILNRVTTVDVYLDNVLRRKSVEPRYSSRLAAQPIAELDLKIRAQLARFLAATQKSRHHSRIKVVTWVLCGMLAKIHAVLQLDDRLPDEIDDSSSARPPQRRAEASTSRKSEAKDDDGEEECDCCCIGLDTCCCKCTCSCHRDDSDEDDADEKSDAKEGGADKDGDEASTDDDDPPRPTSKNPADIRHAAETELMQFVAARLALLSPTEPVTPAKAIALLASAEQHIREEMGPGGVSFSVLDAIADVLNPSGDGGKPASSRLAVHPGMQRLVAALQSTNVKQSSPAADAEMASDEHEAEAQSLCRVSSVSDEDVDTFFFSCLRYLRHPASDEHAKVLERLIVAQCCQQFGFDVSDAETRHFLQRRLHEIKSQEEDTDASCESCVQYTGTLQVSEKLSGVTDYDDDSDEVHIADARREEASRRLDECPLLVVDHGVSSAPEGSNDFPRELVLLHLTERVRQILVSAVDSAETRNDGIADESSEDDANGKQFQRRRLARFALEVLVCVPLDVASFVYGLVDTAIQRCAPVTDQDIVSACLSLLEHQHLRVLGERLGKPAWSQAEVEAEAPEQDGDEPPPPSTVVESSPAVDEIDGKEDEAPAAVRVAVVSEVQTQSSPPPDKNHVQVPDTCLADAEMFITELRRSQFGIGLEIADDATRQVLAVQHRRLERALQRLSDELYSEKTHFMLELLQNADDNEYAAGVIPRAEFVLRASPLATATDEIVFCNNEAGFSPANVQAICDVGASTKAAQSSRSIGKKGIGFKSVFKVSDTPEVHSNGFHLQFRARAAAQEEAGGMLGYVLPHWIADRTRWPSTSAGSTFVLPLNRGAPKAMAASLFAFEPSVLLFLRQLRELRVVNERTQRQLHVRREDGPVIPLASLPSSVRSALRLRNKEADVNQWSVRLVTLHVERCNDSKVQRQQQRWLIVKQRVAVPALLGASSGHADVDTDLAVALPLLQSPPTDRGLAWPTTLPTQQPVCCYLPLRSYGFRFILQADFDVPSSREAVQTGSEWNQWVISQLAPLVATAMLASQVPSVVGSASLASPVQSLLSLLTLLPLDSDIQAPFRPVVTELLQLVRQLPCFPLASSGPTNLLAPSNQALDVSELHEEDLELLLSPESSKLWGQTPGLKQVLDLELAQALPPSVKAALRIDRLRVAHVVQLLATAAARQSVQNTARLLELLARLWRREQIRVGARKNASLDMVRQEIRLLRCFPVQGAATRWVSLADTKDTLFLPATGAPETNKDVAMREVLRDQSTLVVLHESLSSLLETAELPSVRRFLIDQLGVREMTSHDVLSHLVLPRMRTLSSDDTARWREDTRFITRHVANCADKPLCSLAPVLKNELRVRTWRGRLIALADGPSRQLVVVLPATARKLDRVVPWLRSKLTAADRGVALDVVASEELAEAVDTSDATVAQLRAKRLWVEICGLPALFDDMESIDDAAMVQVVQWIAEEPNVETKRIVSRELALYFDATWRPRNNAEEAPRTQRPTSWWDQAAWLEGSDGAFYRPSELWLPSPTTDSLFALPTATSLEKRWVVPVSAVDLTSECLHEDWSFRRTPSVQDVLDVLSRISQSRDLQVISLEQVARLYSFLADHTTVGDMQDTARQAVASAFQSQPLIYLPCAATGKPAVMAACGDVVWSTGASSASPLPCFSLDAVYTKSLRGFFVDVCRISRKLSVARLCHHLSTFAWSSLDTVSQWKKDVLPSLELIAKRMQKGKRSQEEPVILETLHQVPWIPIHSDNDKQLRWIAPSVAQKEASVIVMALQDDECAIQELWQSLSSHRSGGGRDLVLIQLESDTLAQVAPLLELCGVESLRSSLRVRPVDWCNWLTTRIIAPSSVLEAHASWQVSSSAALPIAKKAKRIVKKYKKLLRLVLAVWADAFFGAEAGDESEVPASFCQALSEQPLFPFFGHDAQLVSGSGLFINDQSELSQSELLDPSTASLSVLALYPWDHFVPGDNSDDDNDDVPRLRRLLCEVARMQSLEQSLQSEVMVLGAQRDAPSVFQTALAQSLRIAQRVVFHQHRALYGRLDHAALSDLLPNLSAVVVSGDVGALQVLYRLPSVGFVRRRAVGVFLEKRARRVLVAVESAADEGDDARLLQQQLFDVLREICRRCLGDAVATSVANVLYLSTLQQDVESWLESTQLVPPLDAQAGLVWVQGALHEGPNKRLREAATPDALEDGEVEEEPGYKRLKADVPRPQQPWQMEALAAAAAAPPPPFHGGAPRYPAPGASGPGFFGAGPPPALQPDATRLVRASVGPLEVAANTLSLEERMAIGRWGEQYVYEQLCRSVADKQDVQVTWVNEAQESGLPYDITVSSRGSQDVEYIEVKSTRTMEKGVFEISMNELDQAGVHGSRYSIYRVFNAGSADQCRVVRLRNPIALVRQKKISLVLMMQ